MFSEEGICRRVEYPDAGLIIMIGKILIQMIFPSYLKSGISGSGEMRVATSSIIQSF